MEVFYVCCTQKLLALLCLLLPGVNVGVDDWVLSLALLFPPLLCLIFLSHFNLLLGTATASARGQEEKAAALGFKQSVVHRCHLLPDDIFVLFVGDVFQAKCSSISCSHMFTNGFLMISKYKPTRNDFTHKILDFSVLALLNLYHDYIRENNTLHHRM